jgi:hypothetical protein
VNGRAPTGSGCSGGCDEVLMEVERGKRACDYPLFWPAWIRLRALIYCPTIVKIVLMVILIIIG